MISRRKSGALLLWSTMVGGAAFLARPSGASHRSVPGRLSDEIPKVIEGWVEDAKASLVPPSTSQEIQQIYADVLTRGYRAADESRLMLVLAYGGDQSDAMRAHRQEACYRAQGFDVSELRAVEIQVGAHTIRPATRFLATRSFQQEVVSYWMTMGNSIVNGRLDRLTLQIKNGLFGEIQDGYMIRVSSLGRDLSVAAFAHERFLGQLMARVPPSLRGRLTAAS